MRSLPLVSVRKLQVKRSPLTIPKAAFRLPPHLQTFAWPATLRHACRVLSTDDVADAGGMQGAAAKVRIRHRY